MTLGTVCPKNATADYRENGAQNQATLRTQNTGAVLCVDAIHKPQEAGQLHSLIKKWRMVLHERKNICNL